MDIGIPIDVLVPVTTSELINDHASQLWESSVTGLTAYRRLGGTPQPRHARTRAGAYRLAMARGRF